jgi:hypothetical protein
MLFPVRFGILFRSRNVKYLVGSGRKVLQYFLSGTAKTDGPIVAGSGPNRDSIRTLPRFRKAHPTPAPCSRVISSCIAASNLSRSRQREALSSLWARAAKLARQHGLYSNGMNSASGLLPPEEVSAIDRPRAKDDWVELIGSTVTRIPEFSYGTIARPIRP